MSLRPHTPTACSSTLAATDLDRTLVHSARSGGAALPGEVICLERRGNVATASLLRNTAATLVGLAQRAIWVPSTTRSVAEYRRLDLEGRLGTAPRHVVCANGGVLLTGGMPDAAWTAQVAVVLAEAAPLGEMSELLARHLAHLPTPARDRYATPTGSCSACALDIRPRGSRSSRHSAPHIDGGSPLTATRFSCSPRR